MTQIEKERAKDQDWARNHVRRIQRVESWLKDHGVKFMAGRYDEDDWRLRQCAEELIEAIDKGKLS